MRTYNFFTEFQTLLVCLQNKRFSKFNKEVLNMLALSETDKFSSVFPAQHPRAGWVAAILKNLLQDPT